MNKVCIIIGLILLMTSCYKEVILPEYTDDEIFELSGDKGKGIFQLFIQPDLQELIYTSKDTAYTLEDPELVLMLNDEELILKEMRIRGRTTLDYRRKSYSVRLDDPIFVRARQGAEVKKLTRFKLISLSMDYTYINNRIAFGILEQAGVFPLFYRYVEFKINGETQGVYLLVEDPEQFYKEIGSECILRRDYHHSIEDLEYKPDLYNKPSEEYVARFKNIYTQLPDLKGETLLEALESQLDLTQYFRKMAIDFLLQNGDYTDEIYFYSMIEKDEIRFKIIPWDYDDIFSRYPHEVGRSWAPGSTFGARTYDSHQDVLDVIGQKLIFSIEDDLDYAIAMDSLLYARYELVFTELINTMDANMVVSLFSQVGEELTPFYNNEEVIIQSIYDYKPTSFELWQSNMQEKQQLLEERLEFIRKQLNST